ncbi:unnamed protein product [Amoebophrya sp. A25]|nr:unnamed protein product [Amoebophrya sp. A25]|eukprot:GSA25T00022211001.1
MAPSHPADWFAEVSAFRNDVRSLAGALSSPGSSVAQGLGAPFSPLGSTLQSSIEQNKRPQHHPVTLVHPMHALNSDSPLSKHHLEKTRRAELTTDRNRVIPRRTSTTTSSSSTINGYGTAGAGAGVGFQHQHDHTTSAYAGSSAGWSSRLPVPPIVNPTSQDYARWNARPRYDYANADGPKWFSSDTDVPASPSSLAAGNLFGSRGGNNYVNSVGKTSTSSSTSFGSRAGYNSQQIKASTTSRNNHTSIFSPQGTLAPPLLDAAPSFAEVAKRKLVPPQEETRTTSSKKGTKNLGTLVLEQSNEDVIQVIVTPTSVGTIVQDAEEMQQDHDHHGVKIQHQQLKTTTQVGDPDPSSVAAQARMVIGGGSSQQEGGDQHAGSAGSSTRYPIRTLTSPYQALAPGENVAATGMQLLPPSEKHIVALATSIPASSTTASDKDDDERFRDLLQRMQRQIFSSSTLNEEDGSASVTSVAASGREAERQLVALTEARIRDRLLQQGGDNLHQQSAVTTLLPPSFQALSEQQRSSSSSSCRPAGGQLSSDSYGDNFVAGGGRLGASSTTPALSTTSTPLGLHFAASLPTPSEVTALAASSSPYPLDHAVGDQKLAAYAFDQQLAEDGLAPTPFSTTSTSTRLDSDLRTEQIRRNLQASLDFYRNNILPSTKSSVNPCALWMTCFVIVGTVLRASTKQQRE